MPRPSKNRLKSEDGAVTVDWVVVTAAAVGLAVGLYSILNRQTLDLANSSAEALDAYQDVEVAPAGD